MRQIILDGLQPARFDTAGDDCQQDICLADSENPSQDFVPTDPTQEYIPPRPPRTDRGGFQLGSGRMRKHVATQDTGGLSSTPHVSPYRPASPHHHPSPPFEQMHFDSDFINLDPNAGGFFETSYEGGHHSQHLGGDHIHNDQEDDQDQEYNRDQEHDDESTNDSNEAEHSSHDHDEGADQGRQKTIVRRKCGFTKFSMTNYVRWKQENMIVPDGVNAKFLGYHAPLANRQPGRAFLEATS
ncbi:OLC1v1013582C1 [Oldenlandia corymbosa var. corymbosa]|uniref:OLC1v1013582C1 n=1 Tax=Oldenlandia corymbosa var. corymbosa TaxID=529605 RepID=A0AAV1E242_OLDCO|nr:OLC1v1013582C1 [Oldenlandia corymbosa var. corymbosa]